MSPSQSSPVELIEPIERPLNKDGTPVEGTLGKKIKIEVNAFQLKLKVGDRLMTIEDTVKWYQYHVVIKVVKKDNSTTLPPKKKLRNVFAALQATGVFGEVKPVYDGRNLAYSAKPLALDDLENYVVKVENDGNYTVSIRDQIVLSPSELVKWYMQSTSVVQHGEMQACLAALNVLFSYGPGLALPTSKTTFYLSDPRKYGLSDAHKPFQLSKGIELWRGFFQAVRTASKELYWNLDTTSGAFIQSGNMADFLKRFVGSSNFRALDARDRIRINRLIRHCGVTINLGNSAAVLHRKIGVGLTELSARDYTFEIDDGSGVDRVSVENYFKKHHSIGLKEPHLPCIEIRKGTVFPIELVSLKPGNKYLQKLDPEQQLRATEFQTIGPKERLKVITAIAGSDTLSRPYFSQFGIEAHPHPRKVLGRVLEPPAIDYKASGKQLVDRGVWRMQRHTKLAEGSEVESYAIVASVPQNLASKVMEAMVAILRGCSDLGVRFPQPPTKSIVFCHDSRYPAEETITRAIAEGGDAFGSRPQIIFWIFNVANDPNYHQLKATGMRLGIATQALQYRNCYPKKSSDFQFCINMALKINSKLRGMNHCLLKGSTSGDKKAGWLELHPAMLFGADVSHADGRPSIATVVGSTDRGGICFSDVSTVQGLIEPDVEGGRAKRQELIEHLADMMRRLFVIFLKTTGRVPPPALLFFRDGVSESEWSALMTKEVKAIREGVELFKELALTDEKNKDAILAFNPQLTYVLAVKGHHIRLFGSAEHGSVEGKSGNIPAGTVLDSRVADARAFDWYAAAHTGILGTTKPTRYVVMVNENRMSPDDLQGLTNSLCHSYQRCNRAVSIPAPVYYADLICGKIRGWLPDPDGESTHRTISSDSNGSPHSRESDLENCRNYLKDLENGHSVYLGGKGQRAAMWWM